MISVALLSCDNAHLCKIHAVFPAPRAVLLGSMEPNNASLIRSRLLHREMSKLGTCDAPKRLNLRDGLLHCDRMWTIYSHIH